MSGSTRSGLLMSGGIKNNGQRMNGLTARKTNGTTKTTMVIGRTEKTTRDLS